MFFSTKVLLVVLSLCTRGGLSSNFFRSGKMGTKLRVRRPAPAKHEQVISRADLISEITVPANTCKVDSNSSVAIFVRMYEGHRLARFCTLQSERKICDLWPAKNMWFWSGKKYVLLVWRKICTLGPAKIMHFRSGEKHAPLVRRTTCALGPAKNMHFRSGEKYALLVRRKIMHFGSAKKIMYFWSGENYALSVHSGLTQAQRRCTPK